MAQHIWGRSMLGREDEPPTIEAGSIGSPCCDPELALSGEQHVLTHRHWLALAFVPP